MGRSISPAPPPQIALIENAKKLTKSMMINNPITKRAISIYLSEDYFLELGSCKVIFFIII